MSKNNSNSSATESEQPPQPAAPTKGDLLRKIRELELDHANLKQEMSKLAAADRQRSPHRPPRRRDDAAAIRKGSASVRPSSPLRRESSDTDGWRGGGGVKLPDKPYLNILQSMGQSVYICDLDCRIIYWNKTAENLYGYSAAEAQGQDAIELLTDPMDIPEANSIIDHVATGESWTGQLPLKNKRGERFSATATNSPFYDEDGITLLGFICVANDSRPSQEAKNVGTASKETENDPGMRRNRSIGSFTLGLDLQQPLQAALTSKISNLASKVSNKVKSKMRPSDNQSCQEGGTGEDNNQLDRKFPDPLLIDHNKDDEASSLASTPIESAASTPRDAALSAASTPRDAYSTSFVAFSGGTQKEDSTGKRFFSDECEYKPRISKILTKAEALIGKKNLGWPWKGNERDVIDSKSSSRFVWPWLNNDQENEVGPEKIASKSDNMFATETTNQAGGNNEVGPGSWSSLVILNSTSSSISSCGSKSSSADNKVDMDMDCLDAEILWEDLTIGEQVGQGSCGTVYHALWCESDVAAKVFSQQEYSDDVLYTFRQEVSLMKRLRHPNILLFMGAVTSPQHLCIITEFLPRGSLFRLLRRNTSKLEWKRRVHMALDIARGMNYLHRCNPPIVHRDLKSSNLLVDKNWTVKVGDFGLSRLKHDTYLRTKTGKGTPQWMAPEVLRNEPSNEKADVYSFGVVLWELVTQKIPWENLNCMQVIGAVGFMNQRLDMPKDIDPHWASIIESCWHSEPTSRPSFRELVETLKVMHGSHATQRGVAVDVDANCKEV